MIIDFLTVNLKHALADEVTRAQSAETALRAESFASAVYDSGDTAIYFYNADDEVLSTIDCTDFIVDGMIDNVTLSGSILTITFNTDSGKQDITIDLSEFINPENYYTKDEVDSAITVATEDFVTSGDVETQITAATSGLQETLVSGTNIKTINNESLLGSGNITIQGGSGSTNVIELTKAEYEALSAYAPDTFYIITDADSINVDDLATSGDIATINTALSGKADAVTVTPNNAGYLFPKWNEQGVINGNTGQFYTRSWNINGSSKIILVENTVGWYDIFAPNSAGSAGQPLLSNGSGAPVWGTYKFQFISQSAYDAITTKDSNTIYFIIDEN